MGIQSYFIEKKIRQSLIEAKKNNSEHQLNKINKIALIVDENSDFNAHQFSSLVNQLQLEENNFDILSIKSKCNKGLDIKGYRFCTNEVNLFGHIKSESFITFIEKDYDLMIDYVSKKNKYNRLIIAQVKAPLKAGFAQNNPYFYNIILNIKPENIEEFNNELVRYLNILKLL